MADPQSNFYDYEAFVAIPHDTRPGAPPIPEPELLRPLGTVKAREPDHALQVAAEKWPPPADQEREYHVTLATKWRGQRYRGRPTIAVEKVDAVAAAPEDAAEPEPGASDDAPDTLPLVDAPGGGFEGQ